MPPARAILINCKTNEVKEQKIENFKKTVSEKKVYKRKSKKEKDKEDEKQNEFIRQGGDACGDDRLKKLKPISLTGVRGLWG